MTTTPTGFAVYSNVITRPADTTAYAVGDLVADSVTAGSVTPFVFIGTTSDMATPTPPTSRIDRVRLRKSGTSVSSAVFRVHLYAAAPTSIANGDNGAWSTAIAGYIGAVDVTVDRAFTDGAAGAGVPASPTIAYTLPADGNLYALLEARGTYTPASAETFTIITEGYRL